MFPFQTLIHVMSRETGRVVKTFVAETFFYMHIINQFETRDKEYIVLDLCCYRNPKMLECMYIDAIKVRCPRKKRSESDLHVMPIIINI